MIKRYNDFIRTTNESLRNDLSPKLSDKYKSLKEDLIELIEKSLKTSDSKTFEDFLKAYVKNPEDTQIEGLISDADIYEFYLKYRNDVDEILSEIKFYDEKPSEMGVFGVYDYIIKATKKAILESVKLIQTETSSDDSPI
jgi:site-specific DNA-adenine methylase